MQSISVSSLPPACKARFSGETFISISDIFSILPVKVSRPSRIDHDFRLHALVDQVDIMLVNDQHRIPSVADRRSGTADPTRLKTACLIGIVERIAVPHGNCSSAFGLLRYRLAGRGENHSIALALTVQQIDAVS